MPRNDTGQYSLTVPSFTPLTRILNTAVNSVLIDIANNITQSMPPNGVVPMTGPLRTVAGAINDLAVRFESDPGNGFFVSSGNLAIVNNGAITGTFQSSGVVSWAQSHTFAASGFFTGTVIAGNATVVTTWQINGREVTSFNVGTNTPFYNAAAPTTWTKSVAFDDYTLRIVTAGGGTGGTLGWSVVAAKTTFDSASYSVNAHTHTFTAGTTVGGGGATLAPLAGGTNSGQTAPTSSTGTASAHQHTLSMAVQYVDYILCGKD